MFYSSNILRHSQSFLCTWLSADDQEHLLGITGYYGQPIYRKFNEKNNTLLFGLEYQVFHRGPKQCHTFSYRLRYFLQLDGSNIQFLFGFIKKKLCTIEINHHKKTSEQIEDQ